MEVCEVWRGCDSSEHPIFTDRHMLHTLLDMHAAGLCVWVSVCVSRYYKFFSRTKIQFHHILGLKLQSVLFLWCVCVTRDMIHIG